MFKNFVAYRWFMWTSVPFILLQTVFSFIWSTPSVEIPLHDTYFVVSKSLVWLLFSAFFVFIGVFYFVLLRMKQKLHKGLSIVHYFATLLSIIFLIFGMVFSGFFTKSESLDVNTVLFDYIRLKKMIAISTFLLIFGQVLFVINCLIVLFRIRVRL